MTHDRIPPQNSEAEMAALGACLCDSSLVPEVAGIVHTRDFYEPSHERIWNAITDLHNAGNPVDKITVFNALRVKNYDDTIGGMAYLSQLMDTVQTAGSALYYAQIVREKSLLRNLIVAGTKIIELGYDGEVDVPEALAKADAILRSVTERGARLDEGLSAYDAAVQVQLALGQGRTDAQFTPWSKVNEFTGGFFPGELVLWVAAPGMGKTGVALNLADFVAYHHGLVAFFSLEMSSLDITRRMLAMYSSIPARVLRRGDLLPAQYDALGDVAGTVADRKIRYFGRPKSLADMRAILSRLSRDHLVKAVLLDHVGCLDDVTLRPAKVSQHEALERVYAGLLALGAEFKVVIHAIQHVNREGSQTDAEAKRYKRPSLSDIRGGGNAEGQAHVIVFPYRPRPAGTPEEQREGYFILAKNRDGEPGEIEMTYTGARHLWLQRGTLVPWFDLVKLPESEIA